MISKREILKRLEQLEARAESEDSLALIAGEFVRAKQNHEAAYTKFSTAVISHSLAVKERQRNGAD